MPRGARHLLLAFALAVTAAGSLVAPAPAAAHNPPRPPVVDAYIPHHVTETNEAGPWTDCLWAAAAMWIDDWTVGRIQVTRTSLRAASGDTTGGSTFTDLRRAMARKLGWRVATSPDGGDPMTMADLLDRLAHGGSAVVSGDQGRLVGIRGSSGLDLVRWDRGLAAGAAGNRNHAAFVSRYDPALGRVWWADPLGRGRAYQGEWIAVSALRAFVLTDRAGLVFAAATPAVPNFNAPLSGAPVLTVVGDGLAEIRIPFAAGTRTDLRLGLEWQLLPTDAGAAPVVPDLPVVVDAPPDETPAPARRTLIPEPDPTTQTPEPVPATLIPEAVPVASPLRDGLVMPRRVGDSLVATVALPADPGAWHLAITIHDSYDRTLDAGSVEIRVLGPWAAAYAIAAPAAARTGTLLSIPVTVANLGSEAFSPVPEPWQPWATGPSIARLVATWVAPDGTEAPASVGFYPIVVLNPGQQGVFLATVELPGEPGPAVLRIRIIDSIAGPLDLLGTPAADVEITVIQPWLGGPSQ